MIAMLTGSITTLKKLQRQSINNEPGHAILPMATKRVCDSRVWCKPKVLSSGSRLVTNKLSLTWL
jgi:hypothetical protein